MTKAEMEDHFQKYSGLMKHAATAIKANDFGSVITLAEKSWDHLDGTLRHLGKQDLTTIEGIGFVLLYAPILFDCSAIDRLEEFLSGKRRIANAYPTDIDEEILRSRKFMWQAHAVWDRLEKQPTCPQKSLRDIFEDDVESWNTTVRTWRAMNAVVLIAKNNMTHLKLVTRMDGKVVAKCPSCGHLARGTKSAFLDSVRCRICQTNGSFVQITTAGISE